MTLACSDNMAVSASSYKKSVSKTVSTKAGEYDTLITVTVKKDATIKCTVKPADGKPCASTLESHICNTCSTCTILSHDISCKCGVPSNSFSGYAQPKYTGTIKLSKGTHTLSITPLNDGTHPNKQTVKLTIKTSNGKNLLKLGKIKKRDTSY